jgi:hypothetical protein
MESDMQISNEQKVMIRAMTVACNLIIDRLKQQGIEVGSDDIAWAKVREAARELLEASPEIIEDARQVMKGR